MISGEIYCDIARNGSVSVEDRSLSSPTSEKVDDFLRRKAGMINVSGSWRWRSTSADRARRRLDEFVGLRNEIAHRGGPVDVVVLRRDAERGFELIKRLTDSCIATVDRQLEAATGEPLRYRTNL